MQGTALKLPHTVQIRVGGDDGIFACCAYCLAADSSLSCLAFGVRLTDKNGEITAAINSTTSSESARGGLGAFMDVNDRSRNHESQE